MKRIFLCLIYCISISTYSQSPIIEFIYNKQGTVEKKKTVRKGGNLPSFDYIYRDTDTEGFDKLAVVKFTLLRNQNPSIATVFTEFRKAAANINANAFVIDSIETDGNEYTIISSLFRLDKKQKEQNFFSYESNLVVLIGDISPTLYNQNVEYYVNGKSFGIDPYTYIVFEINKNETIKIAINPSVKKKLPVVVPVITPFSVGVFVLNDNRKTDAKIKGKVGKLPVFFTLNDLKHRATGQIEEEIFQIDTCLGMFLMDILEEN